VKTNIRTGSILLLFLLSFLSAISGAQQKLDQLIVYGEGFMFSVKESADWSGDTQNALKFGANVVLHEKGQPLDSYTGLIRVKANEKTDENLAADMRADMKDCKSKYSKVQFRDFALDCSHSHCLAKVFYIPGEFYEYVTYVNPGPKSKIIFSVSLNSEKSKASPKEIEAYRKTTESLTLLSADVRLSGATSPPTH